MKFKYQLLDDKAIPPFKKRASDSGYDISVVELERLRDRFYLADAKLAVSPPEGWYFDLVGRSSLPSKGWHFLGGVGVIDCSYTGSLKLYLEKIDEQPLPELPFRCAQLIPRPLVHWDMEEVKELERTERGSAGFGSTDQEKEDE